MNELGGMEMNFLFRKRSTGSNSRASGDTPENARDNSAGGTVAVLPFEVAKECTSPDKLSLLDVSAQADTASTRSLSGVYILLAEDDEFVGDLLREELSSHGARIRHVLDGKSACSAALGPDRPSVILMDCQMPVMDGFEASRHIRSEESRNGLTAVPIIALTALDREFDRHHSQDAGINAFLMKPVYGSQLSFAIHNVLKAKA